MTRFPDIPTLITERNEALAAWALEQSGFHAEVDRWANHSKRARDRRYRAKKRNRQSARIKGTADRLRAEFRGEA